MLDFKEAVAVAQTFAHGLFSEAELRHMRVEEVEYSKETKQWLITLGWPEPDLRQIGSILGPSGDKLVAAPRVYKQFTIDDASEEVIAMRVRKI
jgi:hypothetical protein